MYEDKTTARTSHWGGGRGPVHPGAFESIRGLALELQGLAVSHDSKREDDAETAKPKAGPHSTSRRRQLVARPRA